MSMIYDIQYMVNDYMPSCNMWCEIQNDLNATDTEMEEAFEENVSESMAGDIESDVEVMAQDWMDRHGCAYEGEFRDAVRKLVNDRLEDDDYDDD